jgi:hypothetical protein
MKQGAFMPFKSQAQRRKFAQGFASSSAPIGCASAATLPVVDNLSYFMLRLSRPGSAALENRPREAPPFYLVERADAATVSLSAVFGGVTRLKILPSGSLNQAVLIDPAT